MGISACERPEDIDFLLKSLKEVLTDAGYKK